jgi:hypothetical protein
MVTKEDVEKAKADYAAAKNARYAAAKAVDAVVSTAYDKYQKLKREYEKPSVTKEDVDKARAAYDGTKAYASDVIDATAAAYDKYQKLKKEYEKCINS